MSNNLDDYQTARQPRPARLFTVLLPLVRSPEMLPSAVRSVQAQTITDFELCIICDGAPPATIACARQLATTDPRIHVFAFAKGARLGEEHRAAVLEGSNARYVAQIGDDDLWFCNHLATIRRLLKRADFVGEAFVRIMPDDSIAILAYGNLNDPGDREAMLAGFNFFGPTQAGYRLSAYRTLPVGWSPGPPGLPSDLHMWQKFLRQGTIRTHSDLSISSLKFGAADWALTPLATRAAFIDRCSTRLREPRFRFGIRLAALTRFACSIEGRQRDFLWRQSPQEYLILLLLRFASRNLALLTRPLAILQGVVLLVRGRFPTRS